MPIRALKDRLQPHLTPRRRRTGLVLIGLALAWTVLGFLALPSVVVSQARAFVADKLKLELSIDELAFNPWMLSVRVTGLEIREPGAGGEVLVAARGVYVNVQLWSSLWLRGASLAELDVQEPFVNVRLRRDGTLNLLQLVPPDEAEDSGESRWRIGLLAVRLGRIAVHDDTRPTPFAARFEPLNLTLTDLASRPDRDGLYTLHAETGEGEALDWRGTLAMQPVRSEGELRISGLRATTPWRYLQDQLPVVVDDGSIGISGHYRLKLDNGVAFSLDKGRVTVEDLALRLRGEDPLTLRLGKLELADLTAEWPAQQAGFGRLALARLELGEDAGKAALAGFTGLALDDARYHPAGQRAGLARVTLEGLRLADTADMPLLQLPKLVLDDLDVGLEARKAHVARIDLQQGELSVVRARNGHLNWQDRLSALAARVERGLVLPATAAPPAAVAAAEQPSGSGAPVPWVATLGELDLTAFKLAVRDELPLTPVATTLEDIHLRLLPRQREGEPHRLEGRLGLSTGGRVALGGRVSEHPLDVEADIDLEGLALPPLAPYFADIARFALESGSLDVKGKLRFAQGKRSSASFLGQVAVRDFAANDLDQDERFLAWKRLAATGIDWRLDPGRLVIRDIEASRPFMRLIVGADKTLNLSHVIVADAEPAAAASPTAPPAAQAGAAPYPLRIDRIRLDNGAMLFADFTLKPQFATGIQSLSGTVTGVSSDPAAHATIALKGRVDQYGRADISGTTSLLASDRHTDLQVRFSDLELTTLTPYSAKFAGYRIDKGKLSLDLGYLIRDRQLEARNKIVFNQLTLGDRVDSPDAMSLPLKLAIAILKDRDGVIDVDLPVTGSLDDPEFRIAPLVWKAFVNLLTKAATAPFTLIAGLVGGSGDMDALPFAAGSADLAAESADKLGKLAGALAQRPALVVEVRGAYDPVADAQALRELRFEAAYQKRLAEGGKPRKVLESMFTEKVGAEALARQRALSLKPVDGGDLRIAETAYLAALRIELAARETILDGDLRELALERARTLRAQLAEVNGIDAARIYVLEPVVVAAADGKVVLKVALSAN